MKEKLPLLFLCLFVALPHAFPQSQCFYSELRDPEDKTWRVRDAIETQNGFLVLIRELSDPQKDSKIVRLSQEGVFLGEVLLTAGDTAMRLCSLYANPFESDCIIGLGVCIPPDGNTTFLKLCLDLDLNETSRSITPLPNPDHEGYLPDDYRFLLTDNGYIAMVKYQRMPHEREMKLCRISNEDELVMVENIPDSFVSYVANLFPVHNDPEGFGVFASKMNSSTGPSNASSCVLVYDGNLQIRDSCDIGNWLVDDGLGVVYEGRIYPYNSMMRPSSDGGYYISSRLYEYYVNGTISTHDESSVLAKTDSNFITQQRFCVIGQLNDTTECPSFFSSVDVDEEGRVYQCSMQNIVLSSWPYGGNGTHLMITKADTDLNVLWQRRFLVDGNIYSAFHIQATTGGGCLVLGNVYDHNSERRQDVFALKIDAEGTLSVPQMKAGIRPYAFYPNPVGEHLAMEFSPDVTPTSVGLYDIQGRLVLSQNTALESVGMENLPAGVYTLRVTLSDGTSYSDKVVKK